MPFGYSYAHGQPAWSLCYVIRRKHFISAKRTGRTK